MNRRNAKEVFLRTKPAQKKGFFFLNDKRVIDRFFLKFITSIILCRG